MIRRARADYRRRDHDQACEDPTNNAADGDQWLRSLESRMEPTMWVRAVIGIVLCAVGTVWILQGTKVIQGSGMSGQSKWAVVGAVVGRGGLSVSCLGRPTSPKETDRVKLKGHRQSKFREADQG